MMTMENNTTEETMYMISKSELEELLTAYHTLAALENGGVDNWNWYGESIREYIKNWLYEMRSELGSDMIDKVKNFEIEDIASYEVLEYDEVV